MARIRTVKPEYFRHELLQDLERDYPSLKPMLVFAGLWTQCDKNGVFEYKPRQLKLDILPFLDFDIAASIALLIGAGMVVLMVHGEGSTGEALGKQQGSTKVKVYGFVPTFKDHQRINGKEKQDSSKFPEPSEMTKHHPVPEVGEALGKQQGSTGEATETTGREGKGREQEGKGKEEKPAKTKSELMLRECMVDNRDMLASKYPHVDLDIELEEMVAKYRHESIGADPFLIVSRWVKNLPVKKEPPQQKATPDKFDLIMKGCR